MVSSLNDSTLHLIINIYWEQELLEKTERFKGIHLTKMEKDRSDFFYTCVQIVLQLNIGIIYITCIILLRMNPPYSEQRVPINQSEPLNLYLLLSKPISCYFNQPVEPTSWRGGSSRKEEDSSFKHIMVYSKQKDGTEISVS